MPPDWGLECPFSWMVLLLLWADGFQLVKQHTITVPQRCQSGLVAIVICIAWTSSISRQTSKEPEISIGKRCLADHNAVLQLPYLTACSRILIPLPSTYSDELISPCRKQQDLVYSER